MAGKSILHLLSIVALAAATALAVTHWDDIRRIRLAIDGPQPAPGGTSQPPIDSPEPPTPSPERPFLLDEEVEQTAAQAAVLPAPAISITNFQGFVDPTTRSQATSLDGTLLTKANQVNLRVVSTEQGKFQILDQLNKAQKIGSGDSVDFTAQSLDQSFALTLPDRPGLYEFHGVLTQGTLVSKATVPLKFLIDRAGPRLLSAVYDDSNLRNSIVVVRFVEDDLQNADPAHPKSLAIRGVDPALERTPAFLPVDVEFVSTQTDQVLLKPASELVPGLYEVVGKWSGMDNGKLITDLAGNSVGAGTTENQVVRFTVLPKGQTGQHVEFPQFTPPRVGDREQPFNPDDFVITRVVRLYYMRNAHRVAQVINRNVRSYAEAAVTQAQREAERARTEAETLTDDRRARDRKAVQEAEALRRAEDQLAETQSALANSIDRAAEIERLTLQLADLGKSKTELEAEIKEIEGRISTLTSEIDALGNTAPNSVLEPKLRERDEKRADLQARQSDLAAVQGQIDSATRLKASYEEIQSEETLSKVAQSDLRGKISELQTSIEGLRTKMLTAQEEAAGAQAKEDRAVENQFRKEVAAATADPDTYVPAKIDSVDPVTQVSISVIGEGLIQLRGPTKGVNQINTMIHQMDSPLGQVKIQIHTVQINGEHGDRMDRVARRIEGHIDLSRYLTSHSLMMLRKSVQEVATEVANDAYQKYDGHTQTDRDRRYLYAFYGRDFIDSLFSMNSEFLYSGNRVLSLNSMDNISLNRALLVLALARGDIRARIMERFMRHVQGELPMDEFRYRVTNGLTTENKHAIKTVTQDATRRYIFANFRSFFETPCASVDALTPIQLEFLRLAQIFKSQMVTEVELKQRIVERGLIQDRSNDETQQFEILSEVQEQIRQKIKELLSQFVANETSYQASLKQAMEIARVLEDVQTVLMKIAEAQTTISNIVDPLSVGNEITQQIENNQEGVPGPPTRDAGIAIREVQSKLASTPEYAQWVNGIKIAARALEKNKDLLKSKERDDLDDIIRHLESEDDKVVLARELLLVGPEALLSMSDKLSESVRELISRLEDFRVVLGSQTSDFSVRIREALSGKPTPHILPGNGQKELHSHYTDLINTIESNFEPSAKRDAISLAVTQSYQAAQDGIDAIDNLARSTQFKDATRQQVDHRKLLDHLIDEKQEKYIELVEGTKSYTANVDAYLKRMVVSLEDDCRIQFYDPAFRRIAGAAREYDVELGQVERTTVLTNNRQLAKVDPTATMEFDLPKRDIVIAEAMKGAKGLVQDYGALLQDPTFLAATSLLSGSPPSSSYSMPLSKMPGLTNEGYQVPLVKSVLPTLPSEPDQRMMIQYGKPKQELGANLEALIPDPAIYSFETGTGYEVRPVIQPDGDSIVYDFDYMYTTNVREPVRPDEKHLGRVKRHFIDTQVQTSTHELREISRFTVALKAARTGRGVPLLEDIPGVGVLFRPLPSAESSLQQNIILGQSTVYPTLFDLMGLRWAPYVVDMDDRRIINEEFVVRGRRELVEHWTFDESSKRTDSFLRLDGDLSRPDLYRQQNLPSPHHPEGYSEQGVIDPTGRNFRSPDPRPAEYRRPPFDEDKGRLQRDPLPLRPDAAYLPALPSGEVYGSVDEALNYPAGELTHPFYPLQDSEIPPPAGAAPALSLPPASPPTFGEPREHHSPSILPPTIGAPLGSAIAAPVSDPNLSRAGSNLPNTAAGPAPHPAAGQFRLRNIFKRNLP